MRFAKKAVRTAIVTTFVVSLVVTRALGRDCQALACGSDLGTERNWTRRYRRAATVVAHDRLVRLSGPGEGMAGFAALAGNPELAAVLKWTAAIPALGPLVQNGGYQKALEETVRQNV
jgi:hypothetical protein